MGWLAIPIPNAPFALQNKGQSWLISTAHKSALHKRQANKRMILTTVSSTAIAAIGWAGGVLRVLFHNGRAYDHPGVPYVIYLGLLLAPSTGAYYNAYIRGRYR